MNKFALGFKTWIKKYCNGIIQNIYHFTRMVLLCFEDSILIVTSQLLIAIAVSVVMMVLHHHLHREPQIVTVDIVGLTQETLKKLSNPAIDSEKSQSLVKNYVLNLEKTLKTLAQENHLIILPKEAVIEGSEDITKIVESLIKEAP
jgi:hypothetical protein